MPLKQFLPISFPTPPRPWQPPVCILSYGFTCFEYLHMKGINTVCDFLRLAAFP